MSITMYIIAPIIHINIHIILTEVTVAQNKLSPNMDSH